MNDSYIVRGMTIGGEWVYGYLSILDKKINYGVDIPAGYYISNEAGMPFAYSVRPETVGKPIGLKDKNGKLIFGGDILLCADGKQGIVQFNRIIYCLYAKNGKIYTPVLISDFEESKIIGNIHDNKNLLLEGKK